jgi:antitoxin (DNA-binding transcriptional repressor) of toxin-antitoxin stability system
LSAYLKKVRAGETVLVLDRDQPVAKIEPVRTDDDPRGRLAMLTREGLIKPAEKRVPMRMLKSRPPAPSKSVLEALLKERREGR